MLWRLLLEEYTELSWNKKGEVWTYKQTLGVIILEGCTVKLAEEEPEVYAFKVGRKH